MASHHHLCLAADSIKHLDCCDVLSYTVQQHWTHALDRPSYSGCLASRHSSCSGSALSKSALLDPMTVAAALLVTTRHLPSGYFW